VVVTFSKPLNPATVLPDGSQFTADNGLTFSAAAVTGGTNTVVTLTSSTQTQGQTYTVTADSSITDAFGFAVDSPNSAMFAGATPAAVVKLNELSPNITGAHDLIELKVTSGGTTSGIALNEIGSSAVQLAVLPAITVATGDLIVVHLTPTGTTGIAPGSETTAKNQFPNATYSANYDGAWDVLGNAVGLTNSNRVLRVVASGGATIDAVPVVLSSAGSPPAAFPGSLQALQGEGLWLPADCGGALCTYVSTPTAVEISVDYLSTGTTPTGNSISRKSATFTMQKSDWNAAATNTFGTDNP
jgi:hypothetical protein